MFNSITERKIRWIQCALTIAWIVLILSLFGDPISSYLTQKENQWSPFRIDRTEYQCPLYVKNPDGQLQVDWRGKSTGTCDSHCSRVQGKCFIDKPYPMGTRIFWGMVVGLIPAFLFIFGHEAWRRICPLSFLMQIPQALGLQLNWKVKEKSWLGRNYLYLQFGLLYAGLSMRLLVINSDRIMLGSFLMFTILAAMTVGFIFNGKTWCHYICPFSPVQKIVTGTGGILESQAHKMKPITPITKSMCRTIESSGKEKGACVACKAACSDIDLEKSYWQELEKPGKRFSQYGYLGLIIGFYGYYWLYAGDWNYYFSGDWAYEENAIGQLFNAGFYLFDRAIPIPKIIAAPVTIAICVAFSYRIGIELEKAYKRFRQWNGMPVKPQIVVHHIYSIYAFLALHILYVFGCRPTIELLVNLPIIIFDFAAFLLTLIWLIRTLSKSTDKYAKESRFSIFLASHHKKVRPMRIDDLIFWRR